MATFQLKRLEMLETSIIAPSSAVTRDTIFQFDVSLEHIMNAESNLITINCNIIVFNELKNNSLGQIRSSCVYEIKDLKKFFNDEKQRFELPEDIIQSLNSISVSTTRGLMFAYFRGTFLHNALLPIIDPKGFSIAEK